MKLKLKTLIGIVLLVGGLLAVVFGGFSYPADSHSLDLGFAELSVQEENTVNIPLWAGAAAIAAGVLVLAVSRKGSTA